MYDIDPVDTQLQGDFEVHNGHRGGLFYYGLH